MFLLVSSTYITFRLHCFGNAIHNGKVFLQLVIVLNVNQSVVTDNFLIGMDQFVAVISKVVIEDTLICQLIMQPQKYLGLA
uniref:Uncharacterized protein n=1 Tax=Solanum tuberosum TaxID=4113 RepID=M1AGV3_SOLTU